MLAEKIYYYEGNQDFTTEQFSNRLLKLIRDVQRKKGKRGIVFFCIGSDRSTGDSLGPLIGYKLDQLLNLDPLKEKMEFPEVTVIGTLEEPVHAINLEKYIEIVNCVYKDHVIVAIDASIGSPDHVGFITLGRGPLKPGLGVSKNLASIGDIFITGIVGACGYFDPLMLQSIRLSVVMQMADCISKGIYFVGKLWKTGDRY